MASSLAETQERVRQSRLTSQVGEDPGYLIGRGLVRDWESSDADIRVAGLRNYYRSPPSFVWLGSVPASKKRPVKDLDQPQLEEVSECLDLFASDSRLLSYPIRLAADACLNYQTGDGLPCFKTLEASGAPGYEQLRVDRICVVEFKGAARIEIVR